MEEQFGVLELLFLFTLMDGLNTVMNWSGSSWFTRRDHLLIVVGLVEQGEKYRFSLAVGIWIRRIHAVRCSVVLELEPAAATVAVHAVAALYVVETT